MKLVVISIIFISITFGCATKPEAPKEYFFETSRTFNADAKTLFNLWNNPKLYSKWMGPKGAKMTFVNSNIKVGKSSIWQMTTSDGMKKFGRLNYKAIEPNSKFQYTQNFCDKKGDLVKLPITAPYPDVLLMTATLEENINHETKMTVKWEVYGNHTDQEVETFKSMRPHMEMGWKQSFDKIEALLPH